MGSDAIGRSAWLTERREAYERTMAGLRIHFDAGQRTLASGAEAVQARADAVDDLVRQLWVEVAPELPGVALLAVGGYGRRELFPYSDIDLLFLLAPKVREDAVKEPVRRLNQQLWDCGLRVSPVTRTLAECARFDRENVEFTLSLLDGRRLAGDEPVADRLLEETVPKLLQRDGRRILGRLAEVTRTRHRKFGDTLFHLEPNLKDCPGGLRDAHTVGWLGRIASGVEGLGVPQPDAEFADARLFLVQARVFLHLRHGRDDNVLDWHAQDEAAAVSLGLGGAGDRGGVGDRGAALAPDAGYWMRLFFRHARSVERTAGLLAEVAGTPPRSSKAAELASRTVSSLSRWTRPGDEAASAGFTVAGDRLLLNVPDGSAGDPAQDPDTALRLFGTMAETGLRLAGESGLRLEGALPILSDRLEDGHGLWLHLRRILLGRYAGRALRAMHALGILELVLPEFHGIDALVIRDAYHRYTVDEHTFVLIDTLHALDEPDTGTEGLALSRRRLGAMLRELPHPGLLYLAALLHDVGKGYVSRDHPAESARLARSVLESLELETHESALVLGLIGHHLEMSAAMRRDVFEAGVVASLAAKVATPEALRMLTLFTYADIAAVHPDALTPWKAENLLIVYGQTAQFLDGQVDGERLLAAEVGAAGSAQAVTDALVGRVAALMPGRRQELEHFLAGLPRRYLQTREPVQVRDDVLMAGRLAEAGRAGPGQEISLRYAAAGSELTVIAQDRSMLFADIAGALAAWGMNIVTANAFGNGQHLVVDTFRFTDPFRTLELNPSERARFVAALKEVLDGQQAAASMLAGRTRAAARRPRVTVADRMLFDDAASEASTLLQVVSQDTPGLLRALALALGAFGCNIEVALVDTEGEMAIDVFYLTRNGRKLDAAEEAELRVRLTAALEAHAA